MRYRHDKKYLHWAVTAFCVVAASITFSVIMFNLPGFFGVIQKVFKTLSSVMYGLVIAYLLNPIVRRVDWLLLPPLKKLLPDKTAWRISRTLGVAIAMALLFFIFYLLVILLGPQLLESLETIVLNLSNYYSKIEALAERILEDNPELSDYVNTAMDQAYQYLQNYIQNELLAKFQTMMLSVTTSLFALIKVAINLVIGLIISVYVLFSKETFLAQARKITVALCKPRTATYLMHVAARADQIFGGYILGKLVDSLIMGVLCYFGMQFIGLPFPALIAVIIGVTNIIPFFGPFIGAIPSTILILVVNPMQGFYFLIFILVLQQLDGNVIGPRILGDATGLAGFWVVASITFFGGMFGFAGMVLGVPVFALLYTILAEFINHCLKDKHFTTITDAYISIESIDDLRTNSTNTASDSEPVQEKSDKPD